MISSESGNSNYRTMLTDGFNQLMSDVIEPKLGNMEGFWPTDLLCAGLASCLNITTRMVLDRKGLAYEKVIIKVDFENEAEGENRFIYSVDIFGDLEDDVRLRIARTIAKSPVVKILTGDVYVEQGYVS